MQPVRTTTSMGIKYRQKLQATMLGAHKLLDLLQCSLPVNVFTFMYTIW
jgi:hypothetical protein